MILVQKYLYHILYKKSKDFTKYSYYSNYDDGIGYITYYFLKDKHEIYFDILNLIIKGGKINE